MQFQVLKTIAEFKEISDEWNHLLTVAASHVPFLRNEYLVSWWSGLGGGEWEDGELFIVICRSNEGTLIGGAPLFITSNLENESALMFMGSIEISDYLDFVSLPGQEKEFISALLEFIDGNVETSVNTLDLYNILDDSPSLDALKSSAEAINWQLFEYTLQPAPGIKLSSSWDEYLSAIKKKQRGEIRRKMRRAENYLEPIRWYIVKDIESLDDEINSFFNLMANDDNKAEFLSPEMRCQQRDIIHTAYKMGWLQLAFLEVGGIKAAAYLNFDYANRIWVYNSGLDFKFRQLSPGWVLLGHLIKHAIEEGRDAFDFMRGDEVYKYRFGGVNRFVKRIKIHR